MLLTLVKVEGHSMEPTLKEGSFFIASSIPFIFSHPKIEDIIIFKFNKKYVVKRLKKITNEKYYLEGDNKKDSLPIMPVKREQILGRLILKI